MRINNTMRMNNSMRINNTCTRSSEVEAVTVIELCAFRLGDNEVHRKKRFCYTYKIVC